MARRAGNPPLHTAASLGQAETAALLLDRGADIKARNGNGLTHLDIAEQDNHPPETSQFLPERRSQ